VWKDPAPAGLRQNTKQKKKTQTQQKQKKKKTKPKNREKEPQKRGKGKFSLPGAGKTRGKPGPSISNGGEKREGKIFQKTRRKLNRGKNTIGKRGRGEVTLVERPRRRPEET